MIVTRRIRRSLQLLAATSVGVLIAAAGVSRVAAAPQGKNSCGCSQDSTGACYCERAARCGCPGECEPKGCAEKREKQLQKEIELETKKATVEMSKHPTSAPKAAAASQARGADTGSKRGGPPHLTTKDTQELGRLLKAYLEEHPADRQETLEATRAKLAR